MKKVLLVTLMLMLTAGAAMADHIGIYTDATGANCLLAPGFNSTSAVIHKFTLGATGSRFKLTLPPGSQFFSFATTFVPIGTLTSDLSLGYGTCLSGSIVLGSPVVIYSVGLLEVLAADGFATIIYTNCDFGEFPATGGKGSTDAANPVNCDLATESSTWGKVKSLYK